LLLALLIAAPLALIAGVPNAQAHETCAHHPSDPDALGSGAANSVVCLKDDPTHAGGHDRIDICDRDPDGHYVYARISRYAGDPNPYIFYDTDGYGGLCRHIGVNPGGIYAYNVCVQYENCGSPIYWWQF
jgi:hypothetical protein